jgi:glycosyltransferase involved in cell wall biosynthesis
MTEKTNNHAPTVSIGMPVYNGEEYIREALDSLLAQTFTDFELIISDNCSTDKTQEICNEYSTRDSRIIYIRQDMNIGPAANFEFVLQKSSGKYFMWAAHDDRWKCTFLEKLVAILMSDRECGLAFSNYVVKNLQTGVEIPHRVHASAADNLACNFMIRTFYFCPSLVYGLYKIDLVKNTKFENFDFADVHFISELSLKSKIRVVDDYLYIAGTKGERLPYSLNDKKISRSQFLGKQSNLLKKHFSFPVNYLLFIIVCLFMAYNKIRLWRY